MKARVAALSLGFLASCSSTSEPKPIGALNSLDFAGNAAKLASFVQQQCLGRAEDMSSFEAGLKAAGWPFKRTQTANAANPLELDVWETPNVTVMRGQPVTGGVWTCSISIAKPLAPTRDDARAALTRAARASPDADNEWWWNDRRHRFHMDVSSSTDGGIFVNVEDYRLPWWRTILG